MNFIIIFLTILFLLPNSSFAGSGYYEECYYETGDRISLSVSGRVSKEKDKGIFLYSYSIKSNPQSEQDVERFKVILPEKGIIVDATTPAGWGGPGWSGKPTKYGHLRQSELPPPYSIGWFAPEGMDIKPSTKVFGFAFRTSFGLPGIVAYYAEGVGYLMCEAEPDGNFIPGYHDLTPYGPGIVGRTIGPTALPLPFLPTDFLNYIISLKHEAFKLGWIVQGWDDDKGKKEDEEKGIMKSLDKKLEKAKAELVKGDTKEAVEKLKSFIHEVEALYKEDKEEKHKKEKEGHSHITSEAYALLKYNAVYLIEKLGGEWKDKNDKKD